jgi:hypothetical protein
MKASLGAATVGLFLLMPWGATRAQEPTGVYAIKTCIAVGDRMSGFDKTWYWQTYKCDGPTAAVVKVIGQLERRQLVTSAYAAYVKERYPRDYNGRLRGVTTSMTCNDQVSVLSWPHHCTVVVRQPRGRGHRHFR